MADFKKTLLTARVPADIRIPSWKNDWNAMPEEDLRK
jgi:hypothetical protein